MLLLIALFSLVLKAQTKPASTMSVAEYCQELGKAGQQTDALSSACQFALSIQNRVPNYICDETVRRFNSSDELLDVTEMEVRVENGKDSYSKIRMDKKPGRKSWDMPWIWSSGEFGVLLTVLFLPENKPSFKYVKEAQLYSGTAVVFGFEVHERDNKSLYVWNLYGEKWTPGYSGLIWLDKDSHRPLQLEIASTRVPSKIIQKMEVKVTYGDIPLTDGTTFVLPVRANVKASRFLVEGLRQDWIRNDLEFTNCHKFRAKAEVVDVE